MATLTVHMIGNAHLDPVWLWTWPFGLDEAINTCRTFCDLLDEHPDLVVTRGEAWVFEQVRTTAPEVFARLQKHVADGRLALVNGWWIQPDCNLPGAVSFEMQSRVGQAWFQEHFDQRVSVGYNVDSFGHDASLPSLLQKHGFDSYCFLRPGWHEKKLPGNLFRWEAPDGAAVIAHRIRPEYTIHDLEQLPKTLDLLIAEATPGVEHTMCFYGVGDHGGGPTREQIEWIRAHQAYQPGVRLKFSSPRAFFDAVKPVAAKLPTVRDELQFHAVGCYSAVHAVKREMRAAEILCDRAAKMVAVFPQAAPADAAAQLDAAWRRILFNQFHDILAGSSLEPAYEHARDELGQAKAVAREIIVGISRKLAHALPGEAVPRLALRNTADQPLSGLIEVEPWLYWKQAAAALRLCDPSGAAVASQEVAAQAALAMRARVVQVTIPAHGLTVLRVQMAEPPAAPTDLQVTADTIGNGRVSATPSTTGIGSFNLGAQALLKPPGVRVTVQADPTDTWSHGIPGYNEVVLGTPANQHAWTVRENGPLRGRLRSVVAWDGSRFDWTLEAEADQPLVRIQLRVTWVGRNKIVKLVIPAGFAVRERRDRTANATIVRPLNGQEYPIHHAVTLVGDGAALSAVSLDVFAADVRADGEIRLTLLRCPPYAHHDPMVLADDHPYPITDQGVHTYTVALIAGTQFDPAAVEAELLRQSQPIVVSEVTRGIH